MLKVNALSSVQSDMKLGGYALVGKANTLL
jgi:hypothetical protein